METNLRYPKTTQPHTTMETVHDTLICIPDISGYTEFMGETQLQLSTKVIPALLNEIIYSNSLGLKVSEIEGDAVLFYKLDEIPTPEKLIAQCLLFHKQFHERIEQLNNKYQGHRDGENIADLLGLKIVLHYGKASLNKIGKRIKLIGEDVIVAHRLLKNNIKCKEYILLSENLTQTMSSSGFGTPGELSMQKGSVEYTHLGQLKYYYLALEKIV